MPDLYLPTATSRRGFLKATGAGLGVAAAATLLQACDSNGDDDDAQVTLDFSTDVGVLNYAYALEQLEAAFYAAVVAHSAFGSTFNADEQAVLRDLAAHEAIHRDFFRAAITSAAGASALIPNLTVDFSSVNLGNKASVLTTALTFEDLGVSAYNGAGRYLASDDYLTLAGKIVSVEARHASVVADLLTANRIAGDGQIDTNGLDKALPPRDVLAAADRYIVEPITVTGLPA